jgi:ADP-heptose:LPS heptosyltransferase
MGLGADIIAPGYKPPPHDFHCPLMSLPLAFGTTIDTVPHFDRYIYAPDGHVKKWGAFMNQMTGQKIGIVARGRRSHANDKNRSFDLKAVVAQLPQHTSYVVLQKDLSDDERAFVDSCDNIIAPGEALESFSDTAAICTHLNQVISVDTSVAHLAGALGTPTTLLLAYRPDWRWGADGETTRWYPSVRLLRQTRSRGWGDALRTWHMDCLQDFTQKRSVLCL